MKKPRFPSSLSYASSLSLKSWSSLSLSFPLKSSLSYALAVSLSLKSWSSLSLKSSLSYALAVSLSLSLISCRSTRVQTEIVEHTVHDTLYQMRLHYDSIYVENDHSEQRLTDTLVIHDTKLEYRYRLLHDTIRLTRIDTIPVIRTVEVEKQVSSPPTNRQMLLAIAAFTLLLFFFKRS